MVAFAAVAVAVSAGRRYSWDVEAAVAAFRRGSGALGPWAAPAYVAAHALTLALCPPYAIFFEGAAALFFGFLPGVACVFCAKILGASLSFWIGRSRHAPFVLLHPCLFVVLDQVFWASHGSRDLSLLPVCVISNFEAVWHRSWCPGQ